MLFRATTPAANVAPPKTLRFCKVCQRETPHLIYSGGSVIARVCLPCSEESQRYELDRE